MRDAVAGAAARGAVARIASGAVWPTLGAIIVKCPAGRGTGADSANCVESAYRGLAGGLRNGDSGYWWVYSSMNSWPAL